MKQLKSVEIFADVKCENCVYFNDYRCCFTLPAISVEPVNKCGQGNWLFNGEIINYRHICLELVPFGFVTDVDELICKNCDYYDIARKECHFHQQNIYKTSPGNWCNNGVWLKDESCCGSVYFLYEELIKDAEKGSSQNRKVKSIEIFGDAICENCISYNQSRCCFSLPFVPVVSDYKCNEGQWRHKEKILNLQGISNTLVPDRLVKGIKDLSCRECIFYYPPKEECHFHRQNVYKSGPDDWCSVGEWLYEDKIIGTSRGSLEFLYPKFMEGNDEKRRS